MLTEVSPSLIYGCVLLSLLFGTKSSAAFWFLPTTSCTLFETKRRLGLMKISPTCFHLSQHIHMEMEGRGKRSAAFGKVPELNKLHNTINIELMTALRHASIELFLKVSVDCAEMLLGGGICLQSDSGLLLTLWMACVALIHGGSHQDSTGNPTLKRPRPFSALTDILLRQSAVCLNL